MRIWLLASIVALVITACGDNTREYEQYTDFNERQWVVGEKPRFEFEIVNVQQKYNLYGNIRNTVSYPYARLFYTYSLQDSTGKEIEKNLMSEFLFDSKSGKPFGKSGLGDLYDHRFIMLKDFQFKNPGKYAVTFEQFMRMDTLQGISAVGLRVEKAEAQ
ncbi:gliding motility lipoprotein GldH [Chryseolinea lacunae]|uniref:Gliding motility lipoprotein GldH n=1 Tax=Chryseolinea lacunae TaxID=2801331 RepID=A0ABS1KV67_9BACT|nr:gliding motility lipoprotein GldH [Chryseolinea lacunae]MBL0743304.1 gliding motility lipoprotein GldH [Chryseolinea lacunae]